MDISTTLQNDILGILGRVKDPEMLIRCIESFGLYAPAVDGILCQSEDEIASDAEIKTGALIAQSFVYMASRTYESRPVTTGIMVCTLEQCTALLSEDSDSEWILRFNSPIDINWANVCEIEKYCLLVDGKNSILLSDTLGRIYGILDISNSDIRAESWWNHGYCIVTTKNREVYLYYTWQNPYSAAAVYDGYQWGYEIQDSLHFIRAWLGNLLVSQGKTSMIRIEGKPTEVIEDVGGADSLIELLEKMSELRLSTIVVICSREMFDNLKCSQMLHPLRPELVNSFWKKIEEPIQSYVNIFRLDGAHFLSLELEILAVAQQIVLGKNLGKIQHGAGRTAAKYLSGLIGQSGIVIKVSADGPIKVFQNGEKFEIGELNGSCA